MFRFVVPESGTVSYHGLRLSRHRLLSTDWEVRVEIPSVSFRSR